MKSNQKGFSVVEVLLVVVVVGLIGAVSWLVWDKNKDDDIILNDSVSTISNFQECKDAGYPIAESYPEQCVANGQTYMNTNQKESVSYSSEDWLEYKASGYNIKFADGWKLMKKESSDNSFFTIENSLALVPGEKAVIEEYVASGPGEFLYGFSIDYSLSPNCSSDTSMEKSFKTNEGQDVYKLKTLGPDGDRLQQGDTNYYYCIQLNEGYSLTTGYTIDSEMEDHSLVIESVLKTVEAL